MSADLRLLAALAAILAAVALAPRARRTSTSPGDATALEGGATPASGIRLLSPWFPAILAALFAGAGALTATTWGCLLYTSPSPRD